MDKVGYCAAILCLYIKGITPKEIYKNMVANLQDNTPSCSVVKKWVANFKWGRDSLKDGPRHGRPATVTTQEIFDKIHNM